MLQMIGSKLKYILASRRLCVSKNNLLYRSSVIITRGGFNSVQFEVNMATRIYFEHKRRRSLPKNISILEFEYKCSESIDFIQFTIGYDAIRVRNIDPTTEWKSLCVDISKYKETLLQEMPCSFSCAIPVELIPFSSAPSTIFKIRKVRLRPYNKTEKSKLEFNMACIQNQALSVNFDEYYNQILPCTITDIQEFGEKVNITLTMADLYSDLYLCEIPIFSDVCGNNLSPIQKIKADSKELTLTVDRFTDSYGKTYDRIYSRWILARMLPIGYKICSHGKYVFEINSGNKFASLLPKTKKGVAFSSNVMFESDLNELGVSYTTINIFINDFIRTLPSQNSMPFKYNETTYFAKKSVVETYDKLIQTAYHHDLKVSVVILIRPEQQSDDKVVGLFLEHPEFTSAGIHSLPNMRDSDSVHLYSAALDFLASRYNQPDCIYGRVHYWVAHKKVNSGHVWTNAGSKTIYEFMDIYMKTTRLIYNTVKKYDADAHVLISLSNYWHEQHSEQNCYPTATFISLFKKYCGIEGDFDWGIMYYPTQEDLPNPKYWYNSDASLEYNSKLITPKNIEVLDQWIKFPYNFYKGNKRTLLLSGVSPNTIDYSLQAQKMQAANLAYLTKKVNSCSGIDGYIIQNWLDEPHDRGLKSGLRRCPCDVEDPLGKKKSWFVFRDAQTENEDKTFDFAKSVIGISNWEEILD